MELELEIIVAELLRLQYKIEILCKETGVGLRNLTQAIEQIKVTRTWIKKQIKILKDKKYKGLD